MPATRSAHPTDPLDKHRLGQDLPGPLIHPARGNARAHAVREVSPSDTGSQLTGHHHPDTARTRPTDSASSPPTASHLTNRDSCSCASNEDSCPLEPTRARTSLPGETAHHRWKPSSPRQQPRRTGAHGPPRSPESSPNQPTDKRPPGEHQDASRALASRKKCPRSVHVH